MAEQTFALTNTSKNSIAIGWFQPDRISNEAVNAAFLPSGSPTLYVENVSLTKFGVVQFQLGLDVTTESGVSLENFSSAFELNGKFRFSFEGQPDLIVNGPNAIDSVSTDDDEPYSWTPANGADLTALYNALDAGANGTVTLLLVEDAEAPTVTVNQVPNGDENTTVQLSAAQTGGTYDELDYAWFVTGGTLDDDTAESPVWTRPSVDFNSLVTISLTVTARGTGTNATDGTSDTDSDSRTSAVFNVVLVFTGNAEPIAWSFGVSNATGSATIPGVSGNAKPINWSFGVSSATGSTTESVPPLVLSDFIQPANTELICGALLVASGTTNYYADSDRGGTDTPLDGELGLSDTETVISRIRRHSASELNLNDNDSPVALAIGDYFSLGEGLDATIHMQTADGVESFLVDGAVVTSGGNFVRFSIPTVLSTLLNGIAIDDRFIFAITTPMVSVFTGNAEPIEWSFGVSNATGSTVPPHFTGNAESITWSFGISNATGSATIAGVSGNAEPINWSFGVSQATGTATAAAPSSVLTLGVIGVDAWEGAILLPSELIDGGVEAYFRFFTLLGNSPQMRLAATATGDPEGIGPRFTSEVEGYVEAFTFSTGPTDTYTIPGPDYSTNQFRDPTEPYFWTPPPGMQGLSTWLGNRLTSAITLTIGRSEEPTAFTGQANPISWSFGISNATGTTVPPHFTGDAESIGWSFGISNATGTTVPPHFVGNAEPINWSFGISNTTGSTVPPHFTGDAESINWSFGISNATGTTVPLHFTGNAEPINWSFAFRMQLVLHQL